MYPVIMGEFSQFDPEDLDNMNGRELMFWYKKAHENRFDKAGMLSDLIVSKISKMISGGRKK